MKVSRLTLAEILDTTPTSSQFRDQVASARMYGLTSGGINSQEYELTELGEQATGEHAEVRHRALKAAVINVEPYKLFFESFASKRVPTSVPMRESLTRDAGIPTPYLDESIANLTDDMKTAGLVRNFKGNDWVDLSGTPAPPESEVDDSDSGESRGPDDDDHLDSNLDDAKQETSDSHADKPVADSPKRKRPNKLFIGHGRNKKPLDQLTKILRDLGIPHLVAEDEANVGRPISQKVRETMDQCGAAILVFSADVEYFDKDQNSVWRPSENVSHELGAAAVMYDDRIILFKEESVSLASNFSGIGYITFEKDKLDAKMNELLRELVALKILRLSVGEDE